MLFVCCRLMLLAGRNASPPVTWYPPIRPSAYAPSMNVEGGASRHIPESGVAGSSGSQSETAYSHLGELATGNVSGRPEGPIFSKPSATVAT